MASVIQSIVGTGEKGYSGDGGLAKEATMDNPFHVDIDPTGKYLYIADCFNFRVRRLNLDSGIIENFAGTGLQGHTGDEGCAKDASIDEIYAIQVDKIGNVFICQRFNPSIRVIDKSTNKIRTIVGTGKPGSGEDGVSATKSAMIEPNDCAIDVDGHLLIADVQDQRIRKFDTNTETITTVAGTRVKEHTGDGGPAINAGIFGARAVCTDKIGNIYICEREGNTIRKIDTEGIISTIAGTGEKGYTGDGEDAKYALLNGPKAIRCDNDGNILVVDTENHALRIIYRENNIINTIAGGTLGSGGDGGPSTMAGLARPHGVVTNLSGITYIADSENHRIRTIYYQ